jgi:hypothetical protein
MKGIVKRLSQRVMEEPVAFQALLQGSLATLVTFGLDLSDEQTGSLLTFTALLLGFLTRRAVTPLADPKDDLGNRLVPQGGAAGNVAA